MNSNPFTSIAWMDELQRKAARIMEAGGKAERFTSGLLRNPEEPSLDWYMFVPKVFNHALDIQKVARVSAGGGAVWTQWINFSFAIGDVIYNTPDAYGPWEHGKIKRAFSVVSARPAFYDRDRRVYLPGQVGFQTLTSDGTRLVKTAESQVTQVDFVRLLIAGPEKL